MNENNENIEKNQGNAHPRRKSALREPHQAQNAVPGAPAAGASAREDVDLTEDLPEIVTRQRPAASSSTSPARQANAARQPQRRAAGAPTQSAGNARPQQAARPRQAARPQQIPSAGDARQPQAARPQQASRPRQEVRPQQPVRQPQTYAPEPKDEDYTAAQRSLRSRSKRKTRVKTIVLRTLLVILTIILVLLFSVIALCKTLVSGPSETVRDLLVLSAMQASATKWIPGLFLDDALVREICSKSEDVQEQVIPMDSFMIGSETTAPSGTGDPPATGGEPATGPVTNEPISDEWANAIDGLIYKTYNTATFKAYVMIIKDPSRVYVGTSSNFKEGKIGARIFDIVDREGAVAAINGGEFEDTGGQGTGDNPMGLTYSKGECVWNDKAKRTFIGFDKNNILHAVESITKDEADALGIRDAVSFQNGNVLISNDGVSVSLHYRADNVGVAQRTAIGQRADGAVIFVVTDGRTASSLGATHDDIINLLVSEGAVVAGMLDGGSSAMMYYRDYFVKYGIDTSTLDEYQKLGLVNRYKAFTKPRHLPTFFLVRPES